MWNIGKHDTGRCDNCGEGETIEYVIIKCKKYESERSQLAGSLGEEGVRLGMVGVLAGWVEWEL